MSNFVKATWFENTIFYFSALNAPFKRRPYYLGMKCKIHKKEKLRKLKQVRYEVALERTERL